MNLPQYKEVGSLYTKLTLHFEIFQLKKKMLTLIVLVYFAFHSYLLNSYLYGCLSTHMVFIIFLQIYLVFLKQSKSYQPLREIAQKRSNQSLKQSQPIKQCPLCNRVKPSRYYHCRRCNICVYRMDHHCQWVKNCIAHFNSKPYFHFLLHLFIHSLIVFLYIFIWEFQAITQNHDRKIYLLALILPVVFILYETQRLLKDFYSMVIVNQTLIESYKQVKGQNQSIMKNLEEFFGTKSIILWLIPVYLPFSSTEKSLDLYEETFKIEEKQQDPEELTYADEYLYGKDSEDHHECQQDHEEH